MGFAPPARDRGSAAVKELHTYPNANAGRLQTCAAKGPQTLVVQAGRLHHDFLVTSWTCRSRPAPSRAAIAIPLAWPLSPPPLPAFPPAAPLPSARFWLCPPL